MVFQVRLRNVSCAPPPLDRGDMRAAAKRDLTDDDPADAA